MNYLFQPTTTDGVRQAKIRKKESQSPFSVVDNRKKKSEKPWKRAKNHGKEVQEVVLKYGDQVSSIRPVRPIPEVDYFFENQWRAYRKRAGIDG